MTVTNTTEVEPPTEAELPPPNTPPLPDDGPPPSWMCTYMAQQAATMTSLAASQASLAASQVALERSFKRTTNATNHRLDNLAATLLADVKTAAEAHVHATVDRRVDELLDHNVIKQLKADVTHTIKSGLDGKIKKHLRENVNNKTGIIAIAIDNCSRPTMDCLDELEATQNGLKATLKDTRDYADSLAKDITTLMYHTPDTKDTEDTDLGLKSGPTGDTAVDTDTNRDTTIPLTTCVRSPPPKPHPLFPNAKLTSPMVEPATVSRFPHPAPTATLRSSTTHVAIHPTNATLTLFGNNLAARTYIAWPTASTTTMSMVNQSLTSAHFKHAGTLRLHTLASRKYPSASTT